MLNANGTLWPAKPMMKHATDPRYRPKRPSRAPSARSGYDVSKGGHGLLKAGR